MTCDWQSEQTIELVIIVCVFRSAQTNAHLQTNSLSAAGKLPGHCYNLCVFVCVCSKIWLTDLARPITSPQRVQPLRPLFHLVAPTRLTPCHANAQTLIFSFLTMQQTSTHAHTHTAEWESDRVREWGKNEKVPLSSSDSSASKHQEVGREEYLCVCVGKEGRGCLTTAAVSNFFNKISSLLFKCARKTACCW